MNTLKCYVYNTIMVTIWCDCSWVECTVWHQKITKYAKKEQVLHDWLIHFQFMSSGTVYLGLKQYVLLKYFFKHCVVSNRKKSNLHFHRHHFPSALFQFKKDNNILHTFTFLTTQNIKRICKLDGGRYHFGQNKNTVQRLSKGINVKNPPQKWLITNIYTFNLHCVHRLRS